VIFRTARFVYDARTGFWAAAIYLLMPALWLSSGIVSTDVSLLLFWSLALNAWVHLREEGASWPRAVQLGFAVGLGIMAKYAMLFFLPALGLAVLFDPKTRRALLSVRGITAGALTLIIITPNILWNIDNDFATLSHTAANANIEPGIPFHPDEFFSFWGEQFGVFGPITLVLMGLAVIAALRGRLSSPSGWLAAFVISPLLIISLEAILSRANANWAVSAYVAAPILTAHFCVTSWPRVKTWLAGGLGVQSIICLALVAIYLVPAWTNTLGRANDVKRLRAWPETVKTVTEIYERGHKGQAFSSIAVDKRIIFYDLKYYGIEETAPLYIWREHAVPHNHAELTASLPAASGPVLLLNYGNPKLKAGREDFSAYFKEDFARLEALPPLDIDLGGGKRRKLIVWAGYGYTPTQTR
jgi:4-amino-4-deoxy-L-arabinose transferase-like glycosyltransferase